MKRSLHHKRVGFIPGAQLVQHSEKSQCNASHQQAQEEESRDNISKYRKSIRQSLIPIRDKMVSKLGMDGNLLHWIKTPREARRWQQTWWETPAATPPRPGVRRARPHCPRPSHHTGGPRETCCHPAKTRSEASKPRCPWPSHHTGCPSQGSKMRKGN